MSKELLHTLFNRKFFLDNKDLITEDFFTGSEVKDLYRTIVWAYTKGEIVHDLDCKCLKLLYQSYKPAETEAKKHLVNHILDSLDGEPPISNQVALAILKQSMIRLRSDEAAQELLDGNPPDYEKVRDILTGIDRLKNNETVTDVVDMDINALLERTSKNSRWQFNIPDLSAMCGGLGDGVFTLIAGRVNSGKSLASISLCFSPGGFADQGAKILYLCNEEDAGFTGIRAISSYTGKTIQEIREDKEGTAKRFSNIRDKVIPIDNARVSMSGLARLVEKYKPDIVVADMLDHIQITGEHAREDIRLGQLYRQAREIAKVYRCAFIGVSQTSAESDGKLYYGFDALANSKTDKPAACDLILLLGQNPPDDGGNYSPQRAINVAKNKITGRHGAVNAIIQPEISRLIA